MKTFLILSILFAASLACGQTQSTTPAPPPAPGAKLNYAIRGVPSRGKPFVMAMRDDDSIGSIYQCMKKVHRPHWYLLIPRHGVCEIPPGSIRPGKHMYLAPKYDGVVVALSN